MTTEPGTQATSIPLDEDDSAYAPAHASDDVDDLDVDDLDVDDLDVDDLDEDDLEFQPRKRNGLHWLTLLLIALALWGAGFLAGVLTDRAVAGITG